MTWTLRATVLPEDAADKTVRWTSSDASVATIDDAGVITALTPGQTTITAASEAVASPPPTPSSCRRSPPAATAAAQATRPAPAPARPPLSRPRQLLWPSRRRNRRPLPRLHPSNPKRLSLPSRLPLTPATRWTGQAAGIYSQGDADIPEGGVVQRPDGSRYIKGPLNVIFGYDSCPEDTDLSQPGNTPFTGDCVFCGDYGHDVYHCPILAAEQDPDAFCGD